MKEKINRLQDGLTAVALIIAACLVASILYINDKTIQLWKA